MFSNCRANKITLQWTGPGTILKKLSETNYVVSVPHRKDKSLVYHGNMLKPYCKRPEQINYLSLEAEERIGVHKLDPNNTRRCAILLGYLHDIVRHSEYRTTS
ncbi:hypothetical protein AVEN_100657-1 [Araneus ventricosus]|uniref:Integrase p58-like C-terminal domain-containing protein n=1 Tax=Araneus ventricosus TaxID=182803 RepID=A0A4Y2X223_ARAVE|nr:hypothetical protein AVEN_100657-1 [Araneus ventricosus]